MAGNFKSISVSNKNEEELKIIAIKVAEAFGVPVSVNTAVSYLLRVTRDMEINPTNGVGEA